jgi:hypothetical protein
MVNRTNISATTYSRGLCIDFYNHLSSLDLLGFSQDNGQNDSYNHRNQTELLRRTFVRPTRQATGGMKHKSV